VVEERRRAELRASIRKLIPDERFDNWLADRTKEAPFDRRSFGRSS
jgi:hypothetical protein